MINSLPDTDMCLMKIPYDMTYNELKVHVSLWYIKCGVVYGNHRLSYHTYI